MIASVLRRLLIDDQLSLLTGRTLGEAGAALAVNAIEIDSTLSSWPSHWVRHAWAGGGAHSGGAHHKGLILTSIPEAEQEQYGSLEALNDAQSLVTAASGKLMRIDAWLRSTAVAIGTKEVGLVRISRAEVLKYIANRKGGVHFDPRREMVGLSKKKARREIQNTLLDHGLLRIGHLSGPEFEVVSMAHTLADAEWCSEIVRAARDAAPEDFGGDPSELRFWTGNREADGTGWSTSRFSPAQ